LGVHARRPVSRFTRLRESPADTSNECSDFTQYRRQAKTYVPAEMQVVRVWPGSAAPSNLSRRPIVGVEILRSLNEIAWFIHHGKSIEYCLLLLDLSRFLKL
jgi:hypothetical protein